MNELIKYIKKNKITQRQLADVIGVKSQSYISQMLSSGEIPGKHVIALSEFTGIHPTKLNNKYYPDSKFLHK